MKTTLWTVRLICPAILASVALVVGGCTDATTRDDVADAQEELQEERQDTAEAVREGQEDVADARKDAQPYTVSRPVTSEDAREAQQGVAEAQQEAREEVAEQRQEERQATADLRSTEQQFQATQARDAFVKDAERKLADMEVQINQLKESADAAEGQDKDAINLRVETLENQHDRAEEALEELKDADIANWQTHQQPVRVALQELNSGLNSIR